MKSNDFQTKVINKLDKVDDRLNGIETKQAEMNVSLHEHMRRTELLESSLESVKSEIKPLQKHVSMLEGAVKLIGFLGIFSSIAYGIIRILDFISR